MAYTPFYDLFPKINYNITQKRPANTEQVTNIFLRLGVVKNLINNISSYYVYDIEDGDTPEIVAEKVYNDAGAAWLIMLSNNMMDGQFDWPLDYKSFQQYIIEKYGSVEAAKTKPHHYEKVITRRNTRTNESSTTRFWINQERLTNNMLADVSFSYYKPWVSTTFRTADSTAYESDNETLDLLADLDNGEPFGASLDRGNLALTAEYNDAIYTDMGGDRIEIIIKGVEIMCYDYEQELNDDKKSIKVIKAEYYPYVQEQFKNLVNQNPSYIKRLV